MAKSHLNRTDAIEAGKLRREARASTAALRQEWFIERVMDTVNLSMENRVRIATEMVKNRIITNISRPVTKIVKKGKRGRDPISGRFTPGKTRTIIRDRSKPGEYPKADTTNLMKTVFSDYDQVAGDRFFGYVGTPVHYGLFLELFMDRSFMVRTLHEMESQVTRILSQRIQS